MQVTQVAGHTPSWRLYLNSLIASEISSVTRFYDRLIQTYVRNADEGLLLGLTVCREKTRLTSESHEIPDSSDEANRRTAYLLNGSLNHETDIQSVLSMIRPKLSRTSRVIVVAYNPYWEFLYRLASYLKIRKGETPTTFVTYTDLSNLAKLSGYRVIKMRSIGFCPWRLLGLGSLINALFPTLPLIRKLSFASVITLRPEGIKAPAPRPSLSVIIPARNEKGNIENAILRMPDLGTKIEVVFVEGHSSDGTWEKILEVQEKYKDRYTIKAYKQTGKGKADAVRLGFKNAGCDLLTILDADLTMPPEKLGRFYEAYVSGLADFVNGTRLVYPMEDQAMRFLNRLGNIFFAKALSYVLDARIGDSLCGTKLVAKHDYQRITAWRNHFGDFDPFGDFELLFPAAELGMEIIDIPVRYAARVYGTTNISRFRHGAMLFKMTTIGFFRIKLGKTAAPKKTKVQEPLRLERTV